MTLSGVVGLFKATDKVGGSLLCILAQNLGERGKIFFEGALFTLTVVYIYVNFKDRHAETFFKETRVGVRSVLCYLTRWLMSR